MLFYNIIIYRISVGEKIFSMKKLGFASIRLAQTVEEIGCVVPIDKVDIIESQDTTKK